MSPIRQMLFNSKKSFEDFGLYIESFKIGKPVPKNFTVTVPYMNGSLDFSKALNDKRRIYSTRQIEVTFFFNEVDNISLFEKYDLISMWLLSPFESKLQFEGIRGYFIGKVTHIDEMKSVKRILKLKVNFECQAFKYLEFGEDIWDDFNFNLDVTEYSFYNITEVGQKILLVNQGLTIPPKIICSTDLNITVNGSNFNLKKGENYIKKLILLNGENEIQANSIGTIQFEFRKELL